MPGLPSEDCDGLMAPDIERFEPRRPTLVASALLSVWVLILSLPMFAGRFVAVYPNDQYAAGYAFRHWLAEQWKATGHIPLWNPEIFGGLPFVAGMHGDIFYPTSWLRLVLPTHIAMDLGFSVHYVLAGLFVYLLLRRLKVSWAGAVTGGFAYQLAGPLASLVSPGHDGKLFVSALLPLALIALVMAIRERRWEGYGLLALTVGLGILSPHYQMVYYMLLVAGLFALYLAFGAEDHPAPREAGIMLGVALGAVLLGFGVGTIQLLPFYHYIPFSPRAVSYGGFEQATSYAVPWQHVPEFFLAGFAGSQGTYWGPNFLKYHSEYLGLTVIALAAFGALASERRRLVWWLGGIGLLFLLIGLGASTPFYRVWWSVMPLVKQTRAPGMAMFAVAFVLSVFAAFAVERLERREGGGASRWWMGIGAAVLLLGLAGGWAGFARSLAEGLPPSQYVDHVEAVRQAASAIGAGAAVSGLALLLLGLVTWAWTRGRLPVAVFALGLMTVVSADLWWAARPFWRWSDPPDVELYGQDAITQYLRGQPLPYRVLDLSDFTGFYVYPGSALMAFDIPQLLGHHGNQLHAFNELLGGKNQWTNLFVSRRLWDLFAVQYVLLPAGRDIGRQLPAWRDLAAEFDTVFANVTASSGTQATLLERRTHVPYARVVPEAIPLPDDRAIPVLASPRSGLPFDRIVLVDTATAGPFDSLSTLPDAMASQATVEAWEPGHMKIRLDPAPEKDAWLMVSENWYPDWQVTVDGHAAEAVRGDVSLLTVRVPRGAREVEFQFESPDYRQARMVTFACLLLVVAGLAVPPVLRRRRG